MRILSVVVLCLTFVACAGTQHPVDNNPVGLGAWCEEVTATLCHATAQKCFPNKGNFEAGCQVASREACLSGRDRTLASGRTGDELRQCVKQIDKFDCKALNESTGALTASCAAKVPAPSAAQSAAP